MKATLETLKADLLDRLEESKATRTDKRETLEELYEWVDEVERETRLQALLEEFNNQVEAYADWMRAKTGEVVSLDWTPDIAAHRHDVFVAGGYITRGTTAYEWSEAISIPARRYIIARDFNEFDPKRADMLYKLSDGLVDPRNGEVR